jgi:hypothetical protein
MSGAQDEYDEISAVDGQEAVSTEKTIMRLVSDNMTLSHSAKNRDTSGTN